MDAVPAIRPGLRTDLRPAPQAIAAGDRDVRRHGRGDAALVGEELPRHRALRADDAAGRREPLRRPGTAGHGGQRHAFRAGIHCGPAEQRRGRQGERRLRVSPRPPVPPGGVGLGLREPGPGRAACRDQVPADLEFLAQRHKG